MNKISSLWRVGVLAATVLGGSGGAYAATVFQEDFTSPIVYGDCIVPNAEDQANPRALWRLTSLGTRRTALDINSISSGQLALTSTDANGTGIATKLDSRFDFLSPGQKRKFVIKGVKVSGTGNDVTVRMFRFFIGGQECVGAGWSHFAVTVYENGQFNVSVGKLIPRGDIVPKALIDMNYALPQAADQVELTLDNTDYELSFVFNVPDNGSHPAYQGAFSYRGKHGMDASVWNHQAGLVGYPATIGLFAARGALAQPATNVTVDSITVTDGAP